MKKILFVCTGNTCRSPMAEFILKQKINNSALLGYKISSAGILATPRHSMNEKSIVALDNAKIEHNNFSAKLLDNKLISKYNIIICMTKEHKNIIQKMLENSTNKLYSIDEITNENEISDPYGKTQNEYNECEIELEKACDIILEKLKNNEL